MRRLMRNVPSSVAVLTVHHVDPNTGKPIPIGSTISSLTPVTLSPPHISFNIKYPSSTLDAIRNANGRFRVHFLKESDHAAYIADNFSQGNSDEVIKLRQREIGLLYPHNDASFSQAPRLKSDEVVAALECRMTKEVTVADHIIAIAKVESLKCTRDMNPSLLYINRAYKRYNGSLLLSKTDPSALQDTFYRYPLFPREEDRAQFIALAKDYVKNNEHVLNEPLISAVRLLKTALNIPPGAFGINLPILVHEVKVASGLQSQLPHNLEGLPLVCNFSGRLSSRDITTIVDRAKRLVRAQSETLSVPFQALLELLGAHKFSTGILASDILDALRKDGLARPFESKQVQVQCAPYSWSIDTFEQAEVLVREHLKTLTYPEASHLHTEDLLQVVGLPSALYNYVNQIRPRLTTEVFSEMFSSPAIDIRGDVSLEEARVVIRRITSSVMRDSQILNSSLRAFETDYLRELKVHPMVGGIDLYFLFGKLHATLLKAKHPGEFRKAVDEMTEPQYEKKQIHWTDLQERIRRLLRTHATKIEGWSTADILVAMGISPLSRLEQPLSKGSSTIYSSSYFVALLGRELKEYYFHPEATVEGKPIIAAWLESKFNYEIHKISPNALPQETVPLDTSFDQEMRQKMMNSSDPPTDGQQEEVNRFLDTISEFMPHARTFVEKQVSALRKVKSTAEGDVQIQHSSHDVEPEQ